MVLILLNLTTTMVRVTAGDCQSSIDWNATGLEIVNVVNGNGAPVEFHISREFT